jgi:hypothetical protein
MYFLLDILEQEGMDRYCGLIVDPPGFGGGIWTLIFMEGMDRYN